ncbi:MAG: hypothetical protein OZ921_00580 [Sorangiineae bacterium]|nr:hypothetical protein [Polyangiaceae bacterium]MEB2320978.1 hypothetical protein [Sorangiineae bacterium]
MKLAPVFCTNCGATLPLSVPAPQVRCPYCGTMCSLPPDYVRAAELRLREQEARRPAEPLWRTLSASAPSWAIPTALAVTALLPPAATLVAWLMPALELGEVEVTAFVSLPALLPGAAFALWSFSVSSTTMRFTEALTARRRQDVVTCRQCDAPLAPEPGALAATCGYCGADSLLEDLPAHALTASLAVAMSTLDEAVRKLRARRTMLALGAFGLALVIGGSIALLAIVLRQVAS